MKHYFLKLLFFIFIFFCIDFYLGSYLESIRIIKQDNLSRPKIRMKDFYSQKENIDILILGSSHAYRSFDPYLFEKRLKSKVFNLGSSAQSPISSYFLLEEALRVKHKPQIVIIETYWKSLSGKDKDYEPASFIIDNMELSLNKIFLMIKEFDFPSNFKRISKAYTNRFGVKLYFSPVLGEELNFDSNDTRYYKGYVENDSIATVEQLQNNEFKKYSIKLSKYRLNYLEKTIQLALSKKGKVLLVTAPIPPSCFPDVRDYGNYHEVIKNIAEKYSIDLIDYNLLNQQQKLFGDYHFKDDDHLNKAGVKILNRHLIELLLEKFYE